MSEATDSAAERRRRRRLASTDDPAPAPAVDDPAAQFASADEPADAAAAPASLDASRRRRQRRTLPPLDAGTVETTTTVTTTTTTTTRSRAEARRAARGANAPPRSDSAAELLPFPSAPGVEEASSGIGVDLPQTTYDAEDVLPRSSSAGLAPPPPSMLPHVRSVYAQDGSGDFRRVTMAPAASSVDSQSWLGSCAPGGFAPEAAAPTTEDLEGKPMPPGLGTRAASAISEMWVAPVLFGPGLLAGVATAEIVILSFAINDVSLTPLALYAPAALSINQLHTWVAVASFVGAALRSLTRLRHGLQYAQQPLRRLVDLTILLTLATAAALSLALRPYAWLISSPDITTTLPYLTPRAAPYFVAFVAPLGEWAPPLILARAVCVWVAALASGCPSNDEHYEPRYRVSMLNRVGARSVVAPVDGAPAGGGARAEAERTHNARHALDAAGLPWAAGAMLRVGFWGIVASPEPPPRAMCRSADGGPPLAPLPAALGAHTAEEMRDQFGVRYTLRRDQFSGRLVRLLFFLGVDLAVNCLADGAHYCSIWAPGTFAPGDYYAPLVPDIVFMLTTIIARTAVALVVFLMVVSTAHYKLGLLASISRGYKKTFVLMALVWFVATSTRIARNVRDFMGEASDGGGINGIAREKFFMHRSVTDAEWQASGFDGAFPGGLGDSYLALSGVHLATTAWYYVATLDAARRLARSELYISPLRAQGGDDLGRASQGRVAPV